ncbi:MAG: phosphodiester glycosidase family protein [Bryobacteraceae bacterium]|nr:phosphodiester glycosidase family protein [Bryobacteraceae bacterium]
MRLLLLFCLAWTSLGQTLSGPAAVTVGDPVFLRLADGLKPFPGVVVRVTGPGTETGTVTAATLNLRESPGGTVRGVLYRGDRVLVKGQTGDNWCDVTVSHGGGGFVSCDFLDRLPYGQPVGKTDADGRVVSASLAVVPGEITLAAGEATFTLRVVALEYDNVSSLAPGVTYRERRWIADGDGPFQMQIVEIDPREPNVLLLPVRAKDRAIGKETTSALAKRYGATAAINGGYFVVTPTATGFAGQSSGAYMWNEEVVAGNSLLRSALIRCAEGQVAMDQVRYSGQVATGEATASLTGLNRARSSQDLLWLRPIFGEKSRTDAAGVDAILDSTGRVSRVVDGEGNVDIPANGSVLSGSGAGATFLRTRATPGALLSVRPSLALTTVSGCRPVDVIGGGPMIVTNGQVDVGAENFGHETTRNPRTAFAVTAQGTWLLITLDGRQPASQGMRLDELAAELVNLGAVRAVNLDGGGSTTMVTQDAVRNLPSDVAEREVSDAVLLFSVHDLPSLRQIMDRVALDPGQIDAASIEPLYQRLDRALMAFEDEELDQVRLEIESLRAEIRQRSGSGLTVAAARVLGEATSAYLKLLPQIQQALRRRPPVN